MQISLPALSLLLLAAGLLQVQAQHTHGPGCHDHNLLPGEQQGSQSGNVLELSRQVQGNLGIKTAPAQIKTISRSLQLPLQIIENPQARTLLAAPLQARVTAVHVNIGEQVQAGQPLLSLQPLAIGAEPLTLKAATSGTLRSVETAAGQIVEPSQNLLVITAPDNLLCAISLYPDLDPALLKRGDKIRVLMPQAKATALAAEILRQQEFADADGQAVILAKFKQPPAGLRANMRARAEILLAQQQDAIVVPRQAVLGKLGDNFVFVQREDGNFERREVVIGIKNAEELEIIEGVLPEEAVVIQGNYQLQFINAKAAASGQQQPQDPHNH